MAITKQSFLIPSTSQRVPLHTDPKVNRKIQIETLATLEEIGNDPSKIEARLDELEKEWDIERAIEANAATIALLGLILGAMRGRKWFFLPGVVATFLLQHAVQGWCPPVPILRRMGFRTQREIDNERTILKARIGHLDSIQGSSKEALKSLETN